MTPSFHRGVNRQSAVWTVREEQAGKIPKPAKTHKSTGKILPSLSCDTHHIVFIDHLKMSKIISSK